jgi:hypothetical protein
LLPVRSRDPWPVLPADPCWLRDRTRLCFIPGAHPGVIFACNADAISALDLRVGPIQKLEEALFSMSKATPRAKAARTPGGAASKGGDRPVSRTPPALSPTRSAAPADLGTEFWALAPISLNAVDFADRRGDGTILSSGLMRPQFFWGAVCGREAGPSSSLMRHPRRLFRSLYVSCTITMHGGPQSRQLQENAQDYSGFGLKSQTPAPKSAQLPLARAASNRDKCDRPSVPLIAIF